MTVSALNQILVFDFNIMAWEMIEYVLAIKKKYSQFMKCTPLPPKRLPPQQYSTDIERRYYY